MKYKFVKQLDAGNGQWLGMARLSAGYGVGISEEGVPPNYDETRLSAHLIRLEDGVELDLQHSPGLGDEDPYFRGRRIQWVRVSSGLVVILAEGLLDEPTGGILAPGPGASTTYLFAVSQAVNAITMGDLTLVTYRNDLRFAGRQGFTSDVTLFRDDNGNPVLCATQLTWTEEWPNYPSHPSNDTADGVRFYVARLAVENDLSITVSEDKTTELDEPQAYGFCESRKDLKVASHVSGLIIRQMGPYGAG